MIAAFLGRSLRRGAGAPVTLGVVGMACVCACGLGLCLNGDAFNGLVLEDVTGVEGMGLTGCPKGIEKVVEAFFAPSNGLLPNLGKLYVCHLVAASLLWALDDVEWFKLMFVLAVL